MLLAPKAGETVYDQHGTGGMLIEAIRFMHGDKLTYGASTVRKNLATSAIARMNLFCTELKTSKSHRAIHFAHPII